MQAVFHSLNLIYELLDSICVTNTEQWDEIDQIIFPVVELLNWADQIEFDIEVIDILFKVIEIRGYIPEIYLQIIRKIPQISYIQGNTIKNLFKLINQILIGA